MYGSNLRSTATLKLVSHGGGGVEVCSNFFVFVLSFVGRGLATGRLPSPRRPTRCLGNVKVNLSQPSPLMYMGGADV